jgi:bis(5'-nucleosyl)-tetraphosphatase (symmetrical)
MATYAIGDLQGCYSTLKQLLDLISFNAVRDRLWLVGDIVNRGPDSLATLRFAKDSGDTVTMVLGNHDLHLLMVAAGIAKMNANDTLQPILDAPDREELLFWLRHQKLLHLDNDHVMVHAGLLPAWSVTQAAALAQEVECALRSENFQEVFVRLYGNRPNCWLDDLTGYERLRVIVNAMTRMRICSPNGKMKFSYKGNEQGVPDGYLPWFEAPKRASQESTVICGHWSALGLKVNHNLIALDTGCLWGGSLTAIRLEDRKIFQVPCTKRKSKAR